MFKNKHIFALKIEICALLSISRTFMKIDVILMPQFFFQDAGCMSFLHGVDSDTSDAAFGFYFLLALKMLERKRKRAQLIKPKHDVISAHCTHGGRRLNIVTKCKFTFATCFKLSALK